MFYLILFFALLIFIIALFNNKNKKLQINYNSISKEDIIKLKN